MKRVIIEILERNLHEGYDRYETEFQYLSPLGLMNWEIAPDFPGETQILRVAEEIIIAMWGTNAKDLVKIPSREEAVKWARDQVPGDYRNDDDYIGHVADHMIAWLKRM